MHRSGLGGLWGKSARFHRWTGDEVITSKSCWTAPKNDRAGRGVGRTPFAGGSERWFEFLGFGGGKGKVNGSRAISLEDHLLQGTKRSGNLWNILYIYIYVLQPQHII